ncbi:penicillin acylase family protein [Nonomuraea fuscirosea]|uniref:penicillin acylase family protein n=1 Tax=Nonomuraea fuscirosea TaxID=1291556 RepID=UPI002DDB73A4|nr:penicillin acylase family protein [Nonomuraea fuscirosea]WSA53938.1 penicillin acylase family protein [Nonomuraea fuscirosea]
MKFRPWPAAVTALALAATVTVAAPDTPAAATSMGLTASAADGPVPSEQDGPVTTEDLPAAGGYAAEIRRTEYGIPHISAKDHGGLGFGYGYAFAQDNLCVLASWVTTLRGERSMFFGPEAESDDPVRPVANLTSDIYFKSVADSGVVPRLLARPAPIGPTEDMRRLVAGYAAGYNAYLRDTGVANLPDPTCRGQAWVRPITATDVWHNLLDLNRLAGGSGLKEAVAGGGGAGPDGPAPGSNAWALGRQATRDGHGMLLADPHFPWNGIRRFYQVQLTIPGVLDVAGASLYGTPVVQIGHNASIAWTHTVSHAHRFSVYRLKLAGGRGGYLVDGKTEPMGRQEIEVRLKDGGIVTRALPTSRYGPVLAAGQSDEYAYALADVNAANLRSADTWLAMAKARNLKELRAAQDTHQGLPFVYTLATDIGGTTTFADASVVPHVTDAMARRCTVLSPDPSLEAYVLDGSTSACQWGEDGDAVVPGIFGPGSQPRLTRADYVANSNNTPWMTNPAAPMTGYDEVWGKVRTDVEPRPRVSLDMIDRRLSGADGLGPRGFTLGTLSATVRSKRNYTFELLRKDVAALCRDHRVLKTAAGERVDVRAACRTLTAWDGRATLDGEGAILWREFYTGLQRPTKPGEPIWRWWRVPFDPEHPLTTPRGLKRDAPQVRQALAEAVKSFEDGGMPLTLTPGQAQRYGSHPIPGCTEAEGCFDRVRMRGRLSGGRYPDVDTGSSFMMAVELTPDGPRTRTILTYSLSANPSSPYHADQTALFARGGWVTERFTEAEIKADPRLRVTTVRG